MLKKTITYTDYNDEERTEDFYFNLSKAEIVKIAARYPGGIKEYLEGIIADHDMESILDMFDMLILESYGKKSTDGRRFIKSKELRDEFRQTEAYSNMLMEFLTDETGGDKMLAFIEGIMPSQLIDEAKKQHLIPA